MKILKNIIMGFATGYMCSDLMTEIPWTKFIILPILLAYLWLSLEAAQMPHCFFLEENRKKYQARWDKKPVFYKKIIIGFDEFIRS